MTAACVSLRVIVVDDDAVVAVGAVADVTDVSRRNTNAGRSSGSSISGSFKTNVLSPSGATFRVAILALALLSPVLMPVLCCDVHSNVAAAAAAAHSRRPVSQVGESLSPRKIR